MGNWLRYPEATSTLGTYTLHNRGSLWYRAWRCLLTLRYYWRARSWINKLGLPNPGLHALPPPTTSVDYTDKIISIYGFNRYEWCELATLIGDVYKPLAVELNLSCPNVDHIVFLTDVMAAIDILIAYKVKIIAKLSPLRWMATAKPLYDYGIRSFHGCNTIQTPGGGFSGKVLKQYSLWCVDDLRQRWGSDIEIIGGGGITSPTDVADYIKAGADRVAICSMLLNPFSWKYLDDLVTAANTKAA